MDAPFTSPMQRIELCERIAVGGMAEVFRAKSYGPHGFAKVLAIKRILPALAADPKFERRFIAEAKLAVTLAHPNIVQVLDFSRLGQSLYIVMEFVDGRDLHQVLELARERQLPLPVDAALYVAIELLRGLEFAHRRGVVHRDVSTSNVLLSRAGEVKIADFGLARAAGIEMTRTFKIMGKWRYMSPEQTRGDELQASSDVFSAATVIHEVLTGQRLFPGSDPEAIVRAIRGGPRVAPSSVRPELPAELDAPMLAALEVDPARRIDCGGLLAALSAVHARTMPTLSLGLARYLEGLLPPPIVGEPDDEGTRSSDILGQILSSEGGRVGKRDRVTAQALAPPPVHPDDAYHDDPAGQPDDPAAGDDAREPGTGTFIRSVPGEDGLSQWLLDESIDVRLDEREDADLTRVRTAAPAAAPLDPAPIARAIELALPAPKPPARPATAPVTPRPPPPAPETSWESDLGAAPAIDAASLAATQRRRDRTVAIAGGLLGVVLVVGWTLWRSSGSTATTAPASSPAIAETVLAPAAPEPSPAAAATAPDLPHPAPTLAIDAAPPPDRAPSAHPPSAAASPIDRRTDAPPSRPDAATSAASAAPEPSAAVDAAPPRDRPGDEVELEFPLDEGVGRTPPAGDRTAARAAAPEFGTIDLFTEPWSEVHFNGKKIGTAPQRAIRLPVGRQRLTLINPVQNRRTTITVSVPSTRTIKVTLPPAP